MRDLPEHDNRKASLPVLTARRARRLRNIAVLAVFGSAAAATVFATAQVENKWPEPNVEAFLMPGEQLMRQRLKAEEASGENQAQNESMASLRARNEENLRQRFDEKEQGLWDKAQGPDGKDDFGTDGDQAAAPATGDAPGEAPEGKGKVFTAEKIQEIIRETFGGPAERSFPVFASLPASSRPSPGGSGGSSRPGAPVTGDAGRHSPTGGGGIAIPVGGIGSEVVRQVLPLDEDEEGENGSIPENPGDDQPDNGPPPPVVPDMPDGEVPIPAPLILLPTGVLIFRAVKARAKA
ncbi:hypothetical protein HK107_08800 [Parvularcula sp. ZS-1/3]|uniref:Uncharacterized protein n=1 Tax=Parvularcula mediterranea TaxID=2732508 RepID=A0A7Y3W5K6_9PROT|nr:hypothetical protein [Parvularcula mediterranea]NNU16417.1 hypothetical protein [Parvularcula mediterranea]